ncbi:BgTH12-04179 [Blumeria graminis f. sp. triticale]|uniref:Bgt-4294 n=3 Tax=Blumeria graminis TaxID=34373 RepID=A0A9X9L9J8_BLUGR|nr:BgTH12-04179 [Blumeria graminis f. sp. triticale]VCU40261.1 Bgt-4294 [Blumeria graminis f. sp. tritici]
MFCGDETSQSRDEHGQNTRYHHPRPWPRLAPLPPRRQIIKRNGSHGPSAYLIRAIRRHSARKNPVVVRKCSLERCKELYTSIPTQGDLATAMARLDISGLDCALWVPKDVSVMYSTEGIGSESSIRNVGMESRHSPTQYVTAQSSLVTLSILYMKTRTIRASGPSPLKPVGLRILTGLSLAPPERRPH